MDEYYSIIKKYLLDKNIPTTNRYGKCLVTASIEGYRKAKISAQSFSNWSKKYFPNKPKGCRISNYILDALDMKFCHKCNSIKYKDEFASNIAKTDGMQSYCKLCMYECQIPHRSYTSSSRREAVIRAMPDWVDINKIKDIYRKCPKDHHVDHIIPLRGEKICGLHVPWNLQYLPSKENLKKANKLIVPAPASVF